VAHQGLETGASILNDVTGFKDAAMLRLAQEANCGLIAMRSRQAGQCFYMPPYEDPTPKAAGVAITELREVRDRLLGAGIAPERILLDPGFGFGTTYQEDWALWQALPSLSAALAWPVERFCLGISRKRFLGFRVGTPNLPAHQRDALTAAAHAEAQAWGFRVFRTHALDRPSGNLRG
jgi:dihydropteroate synthase